MYRFKNEFKSIEIVITRPQKMKITDQTLRQNPHLADFIMNDPNYSKTYGHNLEWVGEGEAPVRKAMASEKIEIDVDVKKKPASASTSTAPPTGGSDLSKSSEGSQGLKSTESQASKPQKKQKASAGKKQDASEATGK